jgi:Ferritin-like domain
MDISNDEFRRQLRDVDEAQRAADKPWREVLKRIFDPESRVSTADKARLIGVPGRRQFLRVGGATILGATVLAACGSDGSKTPAISGAANSSVPSGSASSAAGGGVDDLTLARTAASLEALAVATYQTAASSGKVTTQAVVDIATLYMDHHKQHQDALNGVITGAGGKAITEPNAAVKKALVDPVVNDPALDEAKIVKLAYDLEGAAAQTYVFAAGALSKPELRSTIMTIGGIEARHQTIIGLAMKKMPGDLFPTAFYKSDNPLAGIQGALLTT